MDKVHNKLKDNCQRKDFIDKMQWKRLWLFGEKSKSLQEVFFEKAYHAKPKKRIFSKIKWKFLRRKQFKGKSSKVCFVCKKPGHFAKNCPKKERAAKFLEQAHIHVEDTPFFNVESLFSLNDEYSPQALVVMVYATTEEDSDSLSSDILDPKIQIIYTSQPIVTL